MKFRAKFFLLTGGSVVVAVVLSSLFAIFTFKRFGRDATDLIQDGLKAANTEYLSNYIQTTAERAHMVLDQAFAELQVLADAMQTLADHPEDARRIGAALADSDVFQSALITSTRSNEAAWAQNMPPARSVVSIWKPMLDGGGNIRPDVLRAVQDTAVLDLVLPSMTDAGARKLYMYVVGARHRSFIRLAHYCDMAAEFERNYPGSTSADFWDYFFPGMVDGWNGLANRLSPEDLRRVTTTTPPYEDAAGGGPIISVFHPVWQRGEGRTLFAGAAAMDFSLNNVVDLVRDVRLAQSGFAFISTSSGNVLAIHERGETVMGLDTATSEEGVNVRVREFGRSSQPSLRTLKMPQNDVVHHQRVELLDDRGQGKFYVLTLLRMPPVQVWEAGEADEHSLLGCFRDEHWTLGFMVPEEEIYLTLAAARYKLVRNMASTIRGYVGVGGISILLAILGSFLLSKRMTQGLADLSAAARRLCNKDYGVQLRVQSKDEVGQLSVAFNDMAGEIRAHIRQEQDNSRVLEQTIATRTSELSSVNEGLQREIAERKRTEDELRQAMAAAQAASVAKSEFLTHMSHEIRTPMNAILGMAELLNESVLNPRQAIQLRTLWSSGIHLLDIINDILDISKLEAHRIQLDEAAYDFRGMVKKCMKLLSVQAVEKSIDLSCQIAPEVPSFVLGDALRMRQILINLLGNAVKFTPKGRVGLDVEVRGGTQLRLVVRDTGIGIAEEKIPLLFKRFSQADSSISRQYGGTGLGLAIVREIVEIMGGNIQVESELGQGSVFAVTVPLQPVDAPGAIGSPAAEAVAGRETADPLPPMSLLLVDDMEVNRDLIKYYLEGQPVEIVEASNGKEAVELFTKNKFHVVLMDVEMPEMDGLTAIDLIRNAEANAGDAPCAIFAQTAHALKQQVESCLRAGADRVLVKPVRKRELIHALRAGAGESTTVSVVSRSQPPADPNLSINFPRLIEEYEGNAERAMRMLRKFAEQLAGVNQHLEVALAADDWESVRRIAHKHKGAAANLAADALAACATDLESAACTGRRPECESMAAIFVCECNRLIATIGKLCSKERELS